MIRAYPAEASVDAGGTLVLHVATDAPRFRVRFRPAGGDAPAGGPSSWYDGVDASARPAGEPWGWAAYELRIPPEWPPGAYVAECETEGAADTPQRFDARAAAALFVVRAAAPVPIAVNLPLFTYHAYNVAGVDPGAEPERAECLYSGPRSVSLHRPGGGTGGHLWDEVHPDVYDRTSRRQTFAHWDAKGLEWLRREGIVPAICTDLDLERGALPAGVRLLTLFGHQEYWTRGMRATVRAFLERGGNVAFLCGNTAWFRVRYDAARRAIVRDGKWSDDEPEEALTGTSYRFGGGRWRGPRPPTGYTVADPAHWALAGTGLRAGETFGAQARLVGYECDGAPTGAARPLARAPLAGWATDACGEVLGGSATIVSFALGRGTVFNAGTVDWARLLASGDPAVLRITRNVVARLSAPADAPSGADGRRDERAAAERV